MSYILEALKKAQAERQLGSAPDIHAPAPVQAPAQAVSASRKPLLVGLSAGIVIAGVAGALAWRAQGSAAPQVQAQAPAGELVLAQAAPAHPPAAAPAAAPATPATAPATPAAAAGAAPARTTVAAASPAPAAPAVSAPLAAPAPAPAKTAVAAATPGTPAPASSPAPAQSRPPAQAESAAPAARNPAPAVASRDAAPEAVYLPAPSPAPAPVQAARAPEPAEENLRTFQQLPDALQREIPRVSVGGYIYSPNPADRLLLVDKMLRREGEELAPGLVLERLLPKYAVMNYRGNRYRVGY